MQLKLSGSIYLGVTVLLMLLISGVSAAEELKVDFVSQYNENTYDTASITNAITGEDFISHRGGSITTVVVNGNYAYVGQGQDMLVLNVSDVFNPVEVGRVTINATVNNIVISGNHAYVADGNGLVAVDITNPAAPVITDTSGYFGSGVAVSGNYAYLASGTRGLEIVDINDPEALYRHPTHDTPGYAYDVAVNGSYAYVADGDNGLEIVDITDPDAPIHAGNYNTSGSARGITVSGNYAYIADGTNGLVIVNISNASAPTLAGTRDTAGFAIDVTLSGSNAYVADRTNCLVIINVADPTSPASVGSHNIPSSDASCVDVSGNYSYVAYGRSGLSVLDVTDPTEPNSVAIFTTTAGFANGVVLSDNHAYIANGFMGLLVVNVADPAAPTFAGNYTTTGYAHDLAVSGDHAYVADGTSGLVILNVTNLASPVLSDNYDTSSGHAYGVAISENNAYVAFNSSGLSIVDVTNPENVVGDDYDTAGNAENVAVADGYAYIADGDAGLVIMDINDPTSPVGSYNTTGHANGVAVSGDYAYIADGDNGLVILNITDPTNPTLTGNGTTSYAHDLAISGNYVYIADDSNGIVIFNVTDPAAPIEEGGFNTAGYAYDVAVSNSYVYVADFGNGLVILHVEGADDTTPPASVSGLNETSAGANWIRWAWTNPVDADFSHVMVYFDGAFVTNTSDAFYNSTGLVEGSTHEIGIRTVDDSGNINPTWVNDSATAIIIDAMPPASVTNLEETDADASWINWTWVNPEDDDFSHVMVYLNDAFVTNTTDNTTNSYNATGLTEGTTYTIGIRTVDTSGNINSTLVNDSAIAMSLPEIFSVSGTDITRNSITVTWEASNDTAQVQISRDDAVLGNVSGSTSYVDSGLSSGTTYTYTLVPYNSGGLAGIAVSEDLTTSSSSGGGGGSSRSSGGAGGASASVEDFTNLALKDAKTQYLRMNTNVTYQFTREGNPIQSISFYSLKNAGDTTSTIEVLNNRSKLVSVTPEGSIYKYVNIWVGRAGFATSANIKDPEVKFKVNTSWMQQMDINPENVKLQRYNGTAWEILPTTMGSSTDGYVIYESQTPGFSPFAITAEMALQPPVSSETDVQSNVTDNVTLPTEEKTPGFEALFAVAGLLAVAYLFRRD